jgi:predicted DNA-binding protein (UPF0251 family)
MGRPKTPRPPPTTVGVHVRLAPDDREALRVEALRRLQDGEAQRMDVSIVLRDLITAWREGRVIG